MGQDSRKSLFIKATKLLPTGSEGYYRIVLREFDRADGTDTPPEENAPAMSLVAKPQASIPMIVRGPSSLQSAPLQVTGVRPAPPQTGAGEASSIKSVTLLTLYNPGAIYERIVAISKNEPVGPGNQYLGYVLSGQKVDVGMQDVKSGDHITVQYVIGADAKVDWTSKTDDRRTTSFIVP